MRIKPTRNWTHVEQAKTALWVQPRKATIMLHLAVSNAVDDVPDNDWDGLLIRVFKDGAGNIMGETGVIPSGMWWRIRCLRKRNSGFISGPTPVVVLPCSSGVLS